MTKIPTTPLTTAQAIARARSMITSAQKLAGAAEELANSQNQHSAARDAAEGRKDYHLLNYRVSTVPDALEPVLEALIKAAAGAGSDPAHDA
ncbi:UNVERIFIED_ORG: hypothetical protein ABIB52_000812 [Arthrobacter sp. UYCu721]